MAVSSAFLKIYGRQGESGKQTMRRAVAVERLSGPLAELRAPFNVAESW
jgi:hypothetical protein